jgi:hydroxypyruvate isomerase
MTNREEGSGKREEGRPAAVVRGVVTRRGFLETGAVALAGLTVPGSRSPVPAVSPPSLLPLPSSRIRQSVSRWPYGKIPLPEFVKAAKGIGLAGIDLLQPNEWDLVRDGGLVCSMGYPADRQDFLSYGFNDRSHHAKLLGELERTIPLAAQHGVPNVITMFGNRAGKSDAEGIAASVEGLSKIKALAEEQNVTVCVELLNSKVDHKDYQGDHTAFGVEVMKGVGSPRVKLLYDIYHMQIMEGDVIRTIRDNIAYLGHFHTGGVPGRHELDETQELNWRAVAKAIADLNFQGFVAHEFVPTKDPLTSLKQGFEVCNV